MLYNVWYPLHLCWTKPTFFLIVHCYKYNYFDRSLGADNIDEEIHVYKAIVAIYIEIHQFSHCYISLSFS